MSEDVLSASVNPHRIASVCDALELWWCRLDAMPVESAALAGWLSAAEATRAARFGTEALRRRWIAGRAALRYVLGRLLGIAPDVVPIRRGRRGRPEVANAGTVLDFNVSHTADVALIGTLVGDARARIGVDVERSDRTIRAERLMRKVMTAREQVHLADLPADERRLCFLRYWTFKEAMSKATGDGLIAPFRQLDVDLDPHPRLVDGPAPYSPASFALYAADVPSGHFGAVAVWRTAP